MPRPRSPSGPWATLLRVAWLAIVLGLLLQLAMLLVAAGFGTVAGPRVLLAEMLKTVSWSLLVCVGVALGRVAAKGRVPLEGITGLLAADSWTTSSPGSRACGPGVLSIRWSSCPAVASPSPPVITAGRNGHGRCCRRRSLGLGPGHGCASAGRPRGWRLYRRS
jgi:hypothetical protein